MNKDNLVDYELMNFVLYMVRAKLLTQATTW